MRDRRVGILALVRERRGFTRLEFSLLTAMLGAMVINGIVTLGGGLGEGSKPMGPPDMRADMPTTTMNAAVSLSGPQR